MHELKSEILEDLDTYKRESLVHEDEAVRQLAMFVSRTNNLPYGEALSKTKQAIELNGGIKPAKVLCYTRENGEDKKPETMSMRQYFLDIERNNLTLMPTFTTYLPASVRDSWLGKFVRGNMNNRKKLRAGASLAKSLGEVSKSRRLNVMQVLTKLDNNSISGLALSRGSILFNPTSHSSLTSTTRLITSTCNANSERLLCGRYAFLKVDIALGYYSAILTSLLDVEESQKWLDTIKRFNLVIPTVDEVVENVKRSTDLYFGWTPRADRLVRGYVSGFSDLELAACYYTGSLYNTRMKNPELVRTLLDVVNVKKSSDGTKIENVADKMGELLPEMLMLTHYRFYNEIKGRGKNYPNYPADVLESMYLTAKYYEEHLKDWIPFLSVVIFSRIQPPNVYGFKEVIRDSIVMSDTDSGVHAVERWVDWYSGNTDINVTNMTLSNFLVEITSLALQKLLRGLMVNMNVAESEIKAQRLNLKPEFFMVVFNLMSVSKHYVAGLLIENGEVFEELEIETKGGTLKNSAIPMPVRDCNAEINMGIMLDIIAHSKVSILKYATKAAMMEAQIIVSMFEGKADYLRATNIDSADTYKIKDPMFNASKHHEFWTEIFGKKHDFMVTTPYRAVKIPADLGNKTKLTNWVKNIDPEYGVPLQKWLTKFKRKDLNTIYIPVDYTVAYGLPDVLKDVMNKKRLVMDLCRMIYISMEALAFYRKKDCTILETLGYELNYETLKEIVTSGHVGGLDVGWKVDHKEGDFIPVPEAAELPWD